MKRNSQEVETEMPLKPADSGADQDEREPETKTKGNKNIIAGGIHDCFGTFLNGTSIRGVKQCLNSPYFILRVFWLLFIVLSFVLVITVSSFCIISYTKFQTVVRQTKRPVVGKDFPVVTLCSDGLFSDTEAIREYLNHPLVYDSFLTNRLDFLIKSGNYQQVKHVAWLRTMILYNVNNMKGLQRLMKDELSFRMYRQLGVMRSKKDLTCSTPDGRLCNIAAYYNLKYRNCFSIKVPDGMKDEKLDRMVISGFLLSAKEPPILPESNVINDVLLSGRHIHVFLHELNTLPADIPDFVISMNQDQWILIDFDVTHLQRIVTPLASCAESPVENTTHAGQVIRLSPKVCLELKMRQRIRKECNCEYSQAPFDVWPLNGRHFCGYWKNVNLTKALNELQCVERSIMLAQSDEVTCEVPCSVKTYRSRISINDLERTSYNRIIRENQMTTYISQLKRICRKKKRRPRPSQVRRCKQMTAILKILIKNATINMDDFQKEITTNESNSFYRQHAFPNITEEVINLKEDLQKAAFSMTVRCPKRQVDAEDESLVRTIWTTLAQVGGASSFLAGFTFGVIAEVVETIYKVCIKKSKK